MADTYEITVLDNLAIQARTFVQGACMNLLQLGRVFTEAKPLVPHGEWENWLQENARMSRRSAEQYMQAYAQFGLNPQIAELGTTKVLKLLPMQPDDRNKLLEENDVSSMSTRELDATIKRLKAESMEEARKEVSKELNAEREARETAEANAQQAEIEKKKLEREVKDLEITVEEQQEEYDRMQEELLRTRGGKAKEKEPAEKFSLSELGAAVNKFVGECSRVPQMGYTFSSMDPEEKNQYDELLRVMEAWIRDSRKALETTILEGEVIIDG